MGLNASSTAAIPTINNDLSTLVSTPDDDGHKKATDTQPPPHEQRRPTAAVTALPIAAPQPPRHVRLQQQLSASSSALKAPFCGSPLIIHGDNNNNNNNNNSSISLLSTASVSAYPSYGGGAGSSVQSRLSAAPVLCQLNPETASVGSAKRFVMTGFPISSSTATASSSAPIVTKGRHSIETVKETTLPLPAIRHQDTKVGRTSSIVATTRNPTIPTLITWTGGGQDVYLAGSFNNWKQKIPLCKSERDFSILLQLPEGTTRLKFIVDGEWKCSSDLDSALDAAGNLINYIEVKKRTSATLSSVISGNPLFHAASSRSGISGDLSSAFSSSIAGAALSSGSSDLSGDGEPIIYYQYTQQLPDYLNRHKTDADGPVDNSYGDCSPQQQQTVASSSSLSPTKSTSTRQRSQKSAAASKRKHPLSELPPSLPPQLNRIILNARHHTSNLTRRTSATAEAGRRIDPNSLAVPDHVCLNHVYALSIRDNVMGLATTFRYRNKYSTIILYRPSTTAEASNTDTKA